MCLGFGTRPLLCTPGMPGVPGVLAGAARHALPRRVRMPGVPGLAATLHALRCSAWVAARCRFLSACTCAADGGLLEGGWWWVTAPTAPAAPAAPFWPGDEGGVGGSAERKALVRAFNSGACNHMRWRLLPYAMAGVTRV